ncbi:MAG TPA: transglycosylase SLT domain-containing protein [Xanthobacteraceae bacterium]|nr:transglycosylase SLT domain-containing protein [Xanthobacteraceae bacterium]
MLVDSSNSTAGSAVIGAIRQAAQATGTSFQYLLATAQVESGLNPQAGAATSSARGLFQFIEQTWLATLKQSGTALGYGQYADAITQNGAGKYVVQDPVMRSAILKLRNDPAANAAMAGAFTKENAALLSQKLGRAPSEGELYIAHFLGVGGAAKLISAAADDPNASAANLFPSAAHANTPIFYDHTTGAPRSLAQVRDVLTARYDVAARERPVTGATNVAQAATPSTVSTAMSFAAPANMPVPDAAKIAATRTAVAIVPDTAGVTNAFAAAAPQRAAADVDVFHSLFSDPGRSTPVAAVVSQLWGVGGAGPSAAGGNILGDLFKDDGKES